VDSQAFKREIGTAQADIYAEILDINRRGERELHSLLASSGETPEEQQYLRELAEVLKPFDPGEIPESLRRQLPTFDDTSLDTLAYANRCHPQLTIWEDRLPQQEPLPAGVAFFAYHELYLDTARTRQLPVWLEQVHISMLNMDSGIPTVMPAPLVFTEADRHPSARGRIFDNRRRNEDGSIPLLDFHADIGTHFNSDAWAARFKGYPDQELASRIRHGMTYKTDDRELLTVLQPHMFSLGKAFQAVHKELFKLVDLGWYHIQRELPFSPIIMHPQGAVPKAFYGWSQPRRVVNATAPMSKVPIPGTSRFVISTNVQAGIRDREVTLAEGGEEDTPRLAAHGKSKDRQRRERRDEAAAAPGGRPEQRSSTRLLTFGREGGRAPSCDITFWLEHLPLFQEELGAGALDQAELANEFLRRPEVLHEADKLVAAVRSKLERLPYGSKLLVGLGSRTGTRRSVAMAAEVAARLVMLGWDVNVSHRELKQNGQALKSVPRWVKEVKPTFGELMRNQAIQARLARRIRAPMFGRRDDVWKAFHQFKNAPQVLWQFAIPFLCEQRKDLAVITELCMGMGIGPASLWMQRVATAMMTWHAQDVAREVGAIMPQLLARYGPELEGWLRTRRAMPVTDPWMGQDRMAIGHMYSDDPAFSTVTVEVTVIDALCWFRLCRELNILMAEARKRSMGVSMSWIGAATHGSFGVATVPEQKVLRAVSAIDTILRGEADVGAYRSLVYFLEHLRFIVLRDTRRRMYMLYRPFAKGGELSTGPATPLRKDVERDDQLRD